MRSETGSELGYLPQLLRSIHWVHNMRASHTKINVQPIKRSSSTIRTPVLSAQNADVQARATGQGGCSRGAQPRLPHSQLWLARAPLPAYAPAVIITWASAELHLAAPPGASVWAPSRPVPASSGLQLVSLPAAPRSTPVPRISASAELQPAAPARNGAPSRKRVRRWA